MNPVNANIRGVGLLLLALLTFSLQDIAVRSLGGRYPVLQIVVLRSLIALPCTLLFFRWEGGRGLPSTRQHRLEYLRGLVLFLSYTTYMMALAALPLAEMAAVRNSAPLMITLLSVVWLGEVVGVRRWTALLLGFVGVLLIVRPGSAFNLGSVFILASTLLYALSIMITRQLRAFDSGATMAYHSSLVYVVAPALLVPLSLMVGEVKNAHPSIAFLFHAWTTPSLHDALVMAGLGLVWACGMYLIARAYSLAPASVVAPFEYLLLPINAIWGLLIWHEIPSVLTWLGALLTLCSGLYVLALERPPKPT